MKSINSKRINNRRMVSGALYDFLAYLTNLDPPLTLGASEDCIPAVDRLVEWAKTRGLNIDDSPDLSGWNRKI